jgi:diacylglycerol kinase family enzyme
MPQLDGPVLLVTSAHAGSAQGRDASAALRAAGVTVGQSVEVSTLDGQQLQGEHWKASGYSAVVAAGGDGTVGAVASHLIGSGLLLGILPLGTANDVARSLDLPIELEAAAAVIADGHARTIDVGGAQPAATEPGAIDSLAQANTPGITPERAQARARAAGVGAYFVHALTLGLNVEFARLATDAVRRERLGPLTYIASALQALTTFHPVPIEVRLEGVAAEAYGARVLLPGAATEGTTLQVQRTDAVRLIAGEVIQIAAVNTPVFGGARNFRVPEVSVTDQLIDFIVIEALDPGHIRTLIEGLTSGRTPADVAPPWTGGGRERITLDLPGLWRFQARAAAITTPAGPQDVTLDGEVRARTPLHVWSVPNALRVLVPRPVEKADVSA